MYLFELFVLYNSWKYKRLFSVNAIYTWSWLRTFLRGEHGHDLEAHVLLHGQPEVPEGGDDLGDLLHHGAHVLPQLVHGDGPPHHGGQAGLQRHQVGRHLDIVDV